MCKIIRSPKQNRPFTRIDNHCFNDPNLSWKAMGLLNYLLSRPDDWQIYVGALKNRGPDGKTTTQSALKELIEQGYIERETKQDPKTGHLTGWDYIIYEIPNRVEPQTPKPVEMQGLTFEGKLSSGHK